MQVSLTGVSLHVKEVQKAKEFYLRIPGARLEHERGDFFASIRIGRGRVNLVRVNREEKFHLEFGSDALPQAAIPRALTHPVTLTQISYCNYWFHDDQITSAKSSSIRRKMHAAAASSANVIRVEMASPFQSKGRPRIAARNPSIKPLSGLSLSTHCQ